MTRKALADAFNQLAEAAAKVALELEASEQPQQAAAVDAGAGEPPSPSPRPALDTSVCPKHQVKFTPSKNPEWPSYCSSTTDDRAWGKQKTDRNGNPVLYCRINSKNAGEWLAVHGRAA